MGRNPVKNEPAHRSITRVAHDAPGVGEQLSDRHSARAMSSWWDLFRGHHPPRVERPCFRVTEWGREKLKANPATPYDPDRYLQRLSTAVPDLDPVIRTYWRESVATFRINCLLSSAIALGCASEKALLLLIEAYTAALASPREGTFQ